MDLLLVRHAEAEDAGDSGSDFDRRLTAHGHASAAEMAAGLALCVRNQVALWSSPLLRARETAAHLAQALGVAVSRYPDAIPAGDLGQLRHDWQSLSPQINTLIVVGHQPHLGVWGAQLMGISLPVKKASVIAIALDSAGTGGQLLWYAQPEALARLAQIRHQGWPAL
ncbi:MAG: SixA phosphatase family protein [Acidithiobacillus ferrivorans]